MSAPTSIEATKEYENGKVRRFGGETMDELAQE